MVHIFRDLMVLPHGLEDVFHFFSDAANLEAITPPELCFRIITPTPIIMDADTVIDYRLKLFGIPFQWTARIRLWEPPHRFVDEQLKGPFRLWIHTHRFQERDGSTQIADEVRYALPLWPLGEGFYPLTHRLIERIFRFRKKAIENKFRERTHPPRGF